MPSGIRMANVPHDVPVEKEISAPARNSMAGIRNTGRLPLTRPAM